MSVVMLHAIVVVVVMTGRGDDTGRPVVGGCLVKIGARRRGRIAKVVVVAGRVGCSGCSSCSRMMMMRRGHVVMLHGRLDRTARPVVGGRSRRMVMVVGEGGRGR